MGRIVEGQPITPGSRIILNSNSSLVVAAIPAGVTIENGVTGGQVIAQNSIGAVRISLEGGGNPILQIAQLPAPAPAAGDAPAPVLAPAPEALLAGLPAELPADVAPLGAVDEGAE